MPKRPREAGGTAKSIPAPQLPEELVIDDNSDTDAESDIPESEIEKAITAALKGEVLLDEELDSDALVPISDEEDHDGSENEAIRGKLQHKSDTNGAKTSTNLQETDIQSEDPSDEDEDPDEGDIGLFEQSDSEASSDGDSLFTVIRGADGQPREMRPEIEPGYESDSSTEDTTGGGLNTVGNIDLSLYDKMPHIGYDINGKRVMRPAVGKALDSLLETMEGNPGYTGVTDRNTGLDVKLSEEELDIIKRIKRAEMPEADYNAYEDYVEYFSGVLQETPISAAPEPKRRFVPSKNEQKRVVKIVRAIREGRIVPKKPKSLEKESQRYDIWQDEVSLPDHIMNIPAPKMNLPSHAESYNPPAEYLPSQDEIDAWNKMDPEERSRDFLPKKYPSLRLVPGYADVIKERFERCLDLYLAPRVRRNKLNIDPESLVPKLPSPEDLRPFPNRCTHVMRGHSGRVRCVDASPDGNWLATGSDDASLKIWEVLTGRCVKTIKHFQDDAILTCRWSPNPEVALLAVAAGQNLYLVCPTTLVSEEVEDATRELCQAGYAYQAQNTSTAAAKKEPPCKWLRSSDAQNDEGVLMVISTKKQVKQIDWHRRGDYFSSVAPESPSTVLIHQLSKHTSQSPFSKNKGAVQCVEFHPSKPVLFVASQRYIRIYNLQKQELQRTLQSGVRWISSMSVHPGGDNVIIGSYDKKLAWFDTDLSPKPYKTLKYHTKAVRSVQYHGKYPLFASASDDGTIQVFHGNVYADLSQNALIVPLKILKGHDVKESLGVLDCCWHARQPWLFSAGADGTVRMWT